MPKRVLDVGVEEDGFRSPADRAHVRLIETDSLTERGDYACLSHRWSSASEMILTTQATYAKHRSAIEFRDLGPAYADAVHIQNSKEDWDIQSKQMAQIYAGGKFTIALQRSPTSTKSVTRLESQTCVGGTSKSPPVYAQTTLLHLWHRYGASKDYFPLQGRGWIYQERLLSRRVIHYCDREVYWECGKTQDCESGVETDFPLQNPKGKHATALALDCPSTQPDKHTIKARWRQMVSEYSKLSLTVATDRLPALQGCVEQIKEKAPDNYVHGLWEESLLEDMCWHALAAGTQGRPLELFDFPTWSWASVSGCVYYGGTEAGFHDHARVALGPVEVQAGGDILPHRHVVVTGRLFLTRMSVSDRTVPVEIKIPGEVQTDISIDHNLVVESGTQFP
jgi:hypothetical protein